MPLVGTPPREAPGDAGDSRRDHGRYRITFEIFARRPCDYDNYRIKEVQDCLVEIGFIPDDNYLVLEGEIKSRKVKTKAEERTEITIERLNQIEK